MYQSLKGANALQLGGCRPGSEHRAPFQNSVATSEDEFARPGELEIFLTFPVSQISEPNGECLAQSKGEGFDKVWPSWRRGEGGCEESQG